MLGRLTYQYGVWELEDECVKFTRSLPQAFLLFKRFYYLTKKSKPRREYRIPKLND
jgi:hypothetical protein